MTKRQYRRFTKGFKLEAICLASAISFFGSISSRMLGRR